MIPRTPAAPGFFGSGADGSAAAGPKAIGGGGGAGEREGGFGGWGFVLVSFIVSTCCQERRKGSEGSGLSCEACRTSTAPPKTFSKTSPASRHPSAEGRSSTYSGRSLLRETAARAPRLPHQAAGRRLHQIRGWLHRYWNEPQSDPADRNRRCQGIRCQEARQEET